MNSTTHTTLNIAFYDANSKMALTTDCQSNDDGSRDPMKSNLLTVSTSISISLFTTKLALIQVTFSIVNQPYAISCFSACITKPLHRQRSARLHPWLLSQLFATHQLHHTKGLLLRQPWHHHNKR